MSTFGVIFDMDGVVIDSTQAHFKSWRKIAEELQTTITWEQFLKTFGRPNRDIIPIQFGITEPERIQSLGEQKESAYREFVQGNVKAIPGAVELIRSLQDTAVPMAVGSSGHPMNIRLALEALDLANVFDAIVSGHDVKRGKPDPEVFLTCAARLKVVPQKCVVIEDAPSGVDAALNAGMPVVAVTSTRPRKALSHATVVVDSLQHISVNRLESLVTDRDATP